MQLAEKARQLEAVEVQRRMTGNSTPEAHMLSEHATTL